MIRKAKAVWRGTGRAGNGNPSTDSGVLANTPCSFRTRFENENGTNPEEPDALSQRFDMLNQAFDELSRAADKRSDVLSRAMDQRFGEFGQAMGTVTRGVGGAAPLVV
jgi:hypothetical protein